MWCWGFWLGHDGVGDNDGVWDNDGVKEDHDELMRNMTVSSKGEFWRVVNGCYVWGINCNYAGRSIQCSGN